ncbi:glutamine--fructose-6-phosphate transaminase (isomerizing), partial [Anaerosporobacter sp.]|uniref:glutamine--fructose-6-phosphate transaminase (isomerizing) n=1 Tax=Anaerosporobacter sp. TaxID=1872529 RepID=UPI00289DF9E0
MCGIIGFTGNLDATEVMLNGLSELEYRGYDSAGIAFFQNDTIRTIKTTGKVSNLIEKVASSVDKDTTCGIGHTRWATHGGVSDTNCHPHTFGKVTLIHNGIIENYHELEKEFAKEGKFPVSQTDSEIAAMVIDSLYTGDAYEALRKASDILDGAYGFCILFHDQPGVIYAIRNGSPLVACQSEQGSIIASDMVALIKYSKDYFVLPEHHIAKLDGSQIEVTALDGTVVEPKILHVDWDITSAKKGGYPHYMLKEIHEQPDALHNTITPRVKNGMLDFKEDGIADDVFTDINRVIIIGCGTAMHAGLIGKVMFEKLLRIPVTVEIASEFRYNDPILHKNTLVITISQSGETADTLAALRLSKEAGCKTLSIVNVKGSSIARESDYVFYTHAGPEIAVASTKAYMVQLSSIYMIAFKFAMIRGTISKEACEDYLKQLQDTIKAVATTIDLDKQIEKISECLT